MKLKNASNLSRRALHTSTKLQRNPTQASDVSSEAGDSTYANILRECAASRDLIRGKHVHAHLITNGCSLDVLLGNLLVQMYARCGCIEDALSVFRSSASWDVSSWTSLITANAHNGDASQSFHLFQTMELEGLKPNAAACMAVLSLCPRLGDRGLRFGMQLHARIASMGPELEVFVGNILITMYGRCGDVNQARNVFNTMPVRDVVSWNSMISVYAQSGNGHEALELFHAMQPEAEPNPLTYVCALTACGAIGSLSDGRQIHQSAVETSQLNDQVGDALVHMYARCGSLEDARRAFEQLERKPPSSWSNLMGIYTQRGQAKEAVKLLRLMELEGFKPNGQILTRLLEACASRQSLKEGRAVIERVTATGYDSDVTVGNAVIGLFSKCGDVRSAREAFYRMPERNVVSWNTLITAYAQNGQAKRAVEMYRRMEPEGVKPTDVTYLQVLAACAGCRDLEEGKLVHARVKSCGLDTHLFIGNALVNLYSKCKRLDLAREAFDRIQRKDVVTWNCMMAAYAQLGHSKEALEIYSQMNSVGLQPSKITLVHALQACLNLKSLQETRSIHEEAVHAGLETDVLVGSALVNVYGKCGCLDEARRVFDRMHHKNVVSWSGMIAALAEHGHGKDALWMFQTMDLDGTKPNEITLLSVLDACASTGAIAEGRRTHTRVLGCGFDTDTVVGNSLINMYGKCGHLSSARAVFDNLAWKNVVSWTGMLAGYAQHGYVRETMHLFKEMSLDGTDPNLITFVSLLFNCSHAGVVKSGLEQFHSMVGDFGIIPVPEHYSCMVDLLGRAGWLEQAEELIRTMPVEPDRAAWNSLLGACKVHSHSDRAIRIAQQACDYGLRLASAPYVLLSSMYANGKVELEKESDGEESSLIEVKGRVHEFISGSPSHSRMELIVELYTAMKEGGVVDERVLHSVEMAIGYGLVATPGGTPLNIVNNGVICSHCHAHAKVISKMVGRRIMVRDSNRFHHFEGGSCSCGDYF